MARLAYKISPKTTKKILSLLLVFTMLLSLISRNKVLAAVTTTRVSVSSTGTQGNGYSSSPSISSDGRYIAFESCASNLVSGDTNSTYDIFVHDRTTDTTERVSVASDGTEGDSSSYRASISSDGRYIAFDSWASTLVDGDTNGTADIFVHDRTTDTTERVSVASDGTEGDSSSYRASISSDGRYIAFQSPASNLVSGDTNSRYDIFVHDRTTDTTERVSVKSDGTQGDFDSYSPSISSDGRYIAFYSSATNLVLGDTNNKSDIFVHDRTEGTTERVSVSSDETQGNDFSCSPSISSDGRYVAFYSYASNLVAGDTNNKSDIFVHDRTEGTTERVSVSSDGTEGDSSSYRASISSDGRYIAFYSCASNLVSGDTNSVYDIFVHDRTEGTTERVSVSSDETQGNDFSYSPSISSDGRYIAFQSPASNLVSGDTNDTYDIFVTTGYLSSSFIDPNITQSETSSSVTEGESATYTLVLDTEPTNDVVITLSSDTADVTASPETITFTSENYDTPQTVTITATDDFTDESDFTATISHTVASDDTNYNSFSMDDYVLSVADNDEPAVANNTERPASHRRSPSRSENKSNQNNSNSTSNNSASDSNPAPASNSSSHSFSSNLYLGLSGSEVKKLQQFLNSHSFPIASFGPGSPGNETEFFGRLTHQSLIRFQQFHLIKPAIGYFGPITRSVVQKILDEGGE